MQRLQTTYFSTGHGIKKLQNKKKMILNTLEQKKKKNTKPNSVYKKQLVLCLIKTFLLIWTGNRELQKVSNHLIATFHIRPRYSTYNKKGTKT